MAGRYIRITRKPADIMAGKVEDSVKYVTCECGSLVTREGIYQHRRARVHGIKLEQKRKEEAYTNMYDGVVKRWDDILACISEIENMVPYELFMNLMERHQRYLVQLLGFEEGMVVPKGKRLCICGLVVSVYGKAKHESRSLHNKHLQKRMINEAFEGRQIKFLKLWQSVRDRLLSFAKSDKISDTVKEVLIQEIYQRMDEDFAEIIEIP